MSLLADFKQNTRVPQNSMLSSALPLRLPRTEVSPYVPDRCYLSKMLRHTSYSSEGRKQVGRLPALCEPVSRETRETFEAQEKR
jgi:hypothetical protein